MASPLVVRLTLESMQLNITQHIAEALDPEEIKKVVKAAVDAFDWEAEVAKAVRESAGSLVRRRIEDEVRRVVSHDALVGFIRTATSRQMARDTMTENYRRLIDEAQNRGDYDTMHRLQKALDEAHAILR